MCINFTSVFAIQIGNLDEMARALMNDHGYPRCFTGGTENIGFQSFSIGENYCMRLTDWQMRVNRIMSESNDVNDAVQQVRDAFENVVNETEEMSEQARQSVEEAIDDLEERIEALKDRE